MEITQEPQLQMLQAKIWPLIFQSHASTYIQESSNSDKTTKVLNILE